MSYIEDRIGGSGNVHLGDQSESIVITNKKDQEFSLNRRQFGGNVEVRHGDHNGSIVIKSTNWNEDAIEMLWLQIESSTVKTVGEDNI